MRSQLASRPTISVSSCKVRSLVGRLTISVSKSVQEGTALKKQEQLNEIEACEIE